MKLRIVLLIALAMMTANGATVAKTAKKTTTKAATPTNRIEQMATAMMASYSKQQIQELQTIFAPIIAKYSDKTREFQAEYATSTNKLKVIKSYFPEAEAALKDAQALTVDKKYAAKKKNYVAKAQLLYSMAKAYLSR